MIKKLPLLLAGLPARIAFYFACSVAASFPGVSFSQSVFMQDLNEREETNEFEFAGLRSDGDQAYVIVRGRELWTSYLAANDQDVSIKLGSYDSVYNVTVVGNAVFFTARTNEKGSELYRSNGTPEGTTLVKDIYPGQGSSNPSLLVDVNGTLYFVATTTSAGKEVWKSNGTAESTVLVKDIFPKAGSSNPAHLTNVKGVLFFAANDGTNGYELWKSNGTSAGTTLVKDLRTGLKVSSSPTKFVNVGGTLFFSATQSETGRELYKSDGTASGTVMVKDIRIGVASSNIDNMTSNGNQLIFTANDGVYGDELWKSDGSAEGTVLLKDMTPGGAGSNGEQAGQYKMANFTAINGMVYYTAYDRNNYMIWRTDGTNTGTIALMPAYGAVNEQPRPNFTLMNNEIYFFNSDWPESWSYILMKMSVGGGNLHYVYDVYVNYEGDLYAPELVVVHDKNGANFLYWYGILAFEGYKLLKSSGAPDYDGTYAVPDPYVPTASSNPHAFKQWKNSTYIIANPTWYGNQALWVTEGGSIREHITFSSDGGEFAFTDNSVYASGKDWLELYRTNSMTYGQDYLADNYYELPAIHLTGVRSKMYFTNANAELYVVDDASTSISFLKDFTNLYDLTAVGTNLVFRTRNAANGEELWRSNGTTSGTIRFATISSSAQTQPLYKPTATIKKITHYFIANDGIHGNEIWRTQGSGSATYMMADLNTNDNLFTENGKENDIRSLYEFRDSLYISAVDNTGAWALLKTNGTASGLRKVANIGPVVEMVEAGNALYLFVLENETTDRMQVYVTRGTQTTTKYLFEVPAVRYSHTVLSNALYLKLSLNNQVWRTDGTECGTYPFDLGVEAGNEIIAQGTKLLFAAQHEDKGVEPYYYDTNQLSGLCNQQTLAMNETPAELFTGDENTMSTYPNPFQNEMSLTISGGENAEAKVTVFTLAGVEVEDLGVLKCNTSYGVGANWSTGMYLVKVNNGGKVSAHKVIKSK
jgi:ELWxxDGT repeat protein